MVSSDVIYAGCLFGAIGLGHYYRRITDPELRRLASTLTGMFLVLLVSGWDIVHPIAMIVVNYFIVSRSPVALCQRLSFFFCFVYLFIHRTLHWYGFRLPTDFNNAIVMLLALKLIGVASEIQDYHEYHRSQSKRGEGDRVVEDSRIPSLPIEAIPSFRDMWDYSFCYAGVLTGPYFRYRTYHDMIYSPYAMKASPLPFILERLKYTPIYAFLFFTVSAFFPVEYVLTTEFSENTTFWYRIWYSHPVFLIFRMRFYVAFILSEISCIMIGLGAYPACSKPESGRGPSVPEALKQFEADSTNQDYDFRTVHNIDPFWAEFASTVGGKMRAWNITVQYWMAMNVYRKMSGPKPLRVATTMFVSALWHGVHSGYYLSMLTTPLAMVVEDQWDRLLRRKLSEKGQYVYDWFGWAFAASLFAYMGMAFILLKVTTTVLYFQSVYFYGHVLIAVMYAVGFQLAPFLRSPVKKD